MQKWLQSDHQQKCSLAQSVIPTKHDFALQGEIFKVNFFAVSYFLKVFSFGDMNDWNVPVNISIPYANIDRLLIDDFENGILRHYFSKATVDVDVLQ